MDALEMALLLDYYGGMLTERQRICFDMRYNQDLSLSEIGEALGVSRQAVCDNLTRTEEILHRMEENIGCVNRYKRSRKAVQSILNAAEALMGFPDTMVCTLAQKIISAAKELEE